MLVVCGIDYSLTSPAIAVHSGATWSPSNCVFYYMAHKAKRLVITDQFKGTMYPKYDSDTHRYDNLANWSQSILSSSGVQSAFLEGYAFGAVGRVFQIAENAGLLKYNMWKNDIPFSVFAPSEIKKHATGKGNATKEMLCDAFMEETSIDVRDILDITNKNDWNPLSDIVDSYYIAKLGFMKESESANHP